jgi:hypothetical protein
LRTGNQISGIEIMLDQADLNLITKVANNIKNDIGEDPLKCD